MKNVFPLYEVKSVQAKLKLNSVYGKNAIGLNEDIISHQERIIKELIEENAKYKERILNLIERDLKLVDKYTMPDFKLGLRHAKTIIMMDGE